MSVKDLGPFLYTPLRIQEQEIRLIRLLENDDEEIRCQINHFPLSHPSRYTVLSYRWGSSARVKSMLANGQRLGITESLEIFLREVISRRGSATEPIEWLFGWLWIDAVCINQDDLDERSSQVTMMKDIYENAQSMIIWLGEAVTGTNGAVKLLEEIAELEDEAPNMSDGDVPGASFRLGNSESFVETSYEALAAVSELLNSTYWDRAWILQEASTPKHFDSYHDKDSTTWVCCGSTTTSWKTYAEANNRLIRASWENEVRQNIDLHAVSNTNIATVQYLEERRRQKIFQNPLYTMLVRSRTSDASDPRDKLYAILGLIDEKDDVGLRPDYSLTVEEVYTRLAITIITRSQSLDCLGSAGLVRNHGVPSWVPDWTVQHGRTPQPFYQTDQRWNDDGTVKWQENIFNASKDMAPDFSFDNMGRRLASRGFYFDRVVQVSMSRPWPDEIPQERWQNWTSIANPDNSAYRSGCSRFEAFEKVLKADYNDVWGDWSAERGATIEGFTSPEVNAFELGDGIVDAMTWYRRLLVTSLGYMGIAHASVEPNDAICILFGSQMPMVLREDGDHWLFVGQAYIHGIMDGEAIGGLDIENHSRLFEID